MEALLVFEADEFFSGEAVQSFADRTDPNLVAAAQLISAQFVAGGEFADNDVIA